MATPKTVIVYVWLQDILGNLIGSAQNAKLSVTNRGFDYGNYAILPINQTVSFNSSGYAAIQMVETTTSGARVRFSISYTIGITTKQINFAPAIVPNAGASALTSFANVA